MSRWTQQEAEVERRSNHYSSPLKQDQASNTLTARRPQGTKPNQLLFWWLCYASNKITWYLPDVKDLHMQKIQDYGKGNPTGLAKTFIYIKITYWALGSVVFNTQKKCNVQKHKPGCSDGKWPAGVCLAAPKVRYLQNISAFASCFLEQFTYNQIK